VVAVVLEDEDEDEDEEDLVVVVAAAAAAVVELLLLLMSLLVVLLLLLSLFLFMSKHLLHCTYVSSMCKHMANAVHTSSSSAFLVLILVNILDCWERVFRSVKVVEVRTCFER
jgi:hypothetical protein